MNPAILSPALLAILGSAVGTEKYSDQVESRKNQLSNFLESLNDILEEETERAKQKVQESSPQTDKDVYKRTSVDSRFDDESTRPNSFEELMDEMEEMSIEELSDMYFNAQEILMERLFDSHDELEKIKRNMAQ